MALFPAFLVRLFTSKELDLLTPRRIVLLTAFSYHGTPYIWGGDDPMAGFDCSGLIVECLQAGGILPEGDWTADGLLNYGFSEPSKPKPGDLVFWRTAAGRAGHIELVIAPGFSIGASGGGKANVDLAAAIAKNAFVKFRPITLKDYDSIVYRRPY